MDNDRLSNRNLSCFLIRFLAVLPCPLVSLAFVQLTFANDAAVEVTASGLKFKQMRDISMEREDLHISLDRIEVTYLFRNHSQIPVVTEVAFPVPEYTWSPIGRSMTNFPDFTVEVDGVAKAFATEAQAFAQGKDCTETLKEMSISITNFGGFDLSMEKSFIDDLLPEQTKRLIDAGVLEVVRKPEGEALFPAWSVRMKYHWKQVFPANTSVVIKHTYGPYFGWSAQGLEENDLAGRYKDGCIATDTVAWFKALSADSPHNVYVAWVSYILTTGRNWQGPIREFNLRVRKTNGKERMSSCFSPEVARSSDSYEVHVRDFVPDKDIKIYFLGPMLPLR